MVRWFPRDDENVRAMYNERYGIRQINRTFFDFMMDLDQKVNFIPDKWKFAMLDSIHGVAKSGATSCMAAAPSRS